MSNFSFKDLTVSWKLSFGFGVVLALTALIGFLAYTGVSATLDRVEKADAANRMIKQLQDARMAEKNYIARSDDAEVADFNGLIDEVLAEATDLRNLFTDEQNISLMRALTEQTNQYRAEFKTYVGIEEERERVIEEMRGRAQAVLDLLDQVGDSLSTEVARELDNQGSQAVVRRDIGLAGQANQVVRWMLQARSDEKNFLVFGGTNYAKDVQASIDKVKSQLRAMDSTIANESRSTLIQQAVGSIDAYDQAFTRFVELVREGEQAKLNMIDEARVAMSSAEAAREDQKSQMLAIFENTQRNTLWLPVVAIIVGALFAWLIARMIVPSLQQAAEAARNVSNGVLSIDIPKGSRDEVGVVLNALRQMVESLRELVGNQQSSSLEVASAAEELSAVTSQTSEGVRTQKQEVDQVASAMHEMTASIQEVANNAEQASSAAQESDKITREGTKLVLSSQESIQLLAEDIQASSSMVGNVRDKSANVSTVLDVIKNIAEQTNLLALNAAIEAARAGDQGRGFAVVASEVRSLAQRTQDSTTEIEALIDDLQAGVGQAVTKMDQNRKSAEAAVQQGGAVAEALRRISTAVASIVDMNIQIASAATQQSAVAEEVNQSVLRISEVADQSASGSEEISRSSEELARLGQQLQSMTARFSL